jgi:hypothetical protein
LVEEENGNNSFIEESNGEESQFSAYQREFTTMDKRNTAPKM